jgi:sn-glycerol 3-phosphate transport system substrate-binding protein
MPFNSSTAIFYYNKSIFQKAGLKTDKAPATYEEIEKCAKAAVVSGATKIGFTVAWPSWTLMENMHAWHDQPFSDQDNGFAGLATHLKINGSLGERLMDLISVGRARGSSPIRGASQRATNRSSTEKPP